MRSIILRFFISGALLLLLYSMIRHQIPEILRICALADMKLVGIAFIFMLLSYSVMAFRLKILLKIQGVRLRFRQSVGATYVGVFFNNFLPTAIGGDLVKMYCVSTKTNEMVKAFSGVIADRILGLVVFIFIPFLTTCFMISYLDPMIPKIVFTTFFVAFLGVVLLLNKDWYQKIPTFRKMADKLSILRKLENFHALLSGFFRHKKYVLPLILVTILGQVLNLLAIYGIILSMSPEIGLRHVFLFTPIIHLLTMIPSINGLGVREMGFVYFFGSVVGESTASATAIFYLTFLILSSFIGGAIYFLNHSYHFKWNHLKQMATQLTQQTA